MRRAGRCSPPSPWGGETTYVLRRRIIKPENVLDDLVQSYTDAYNEGRQLNDQRYDDLTVMLNFWPEGIPEVTVSTGRMRLLSQSEKN